MPRSFYRDSVMVKGPAGAIPLAGAAVSFYQEAPPGSPTTPITFPLYPSREDTSPLALPFLTGSLGEVEVWAERSARVRMIVAKGGLVSADETIDLEWPPEDNASNGDVSNAIEAHEAKTDPHQQYLLESEADLLYLPIDYVPPAIPDEYLTQDEGDLRYPLKSDPNPYPQYQTEAESDLRYEQLSRKGQPSGYTPLDPGGLVPNQYLPSLAITDTFVVGSQAEMLALTAQRGDFAIRTDLNKTMVLASDPATVLANWVELLGAGGAASVTSVDGRTGAVDLSDRYLQLTGGELTGQLVMADGDQSHGGLILSGDTGGWLKFGGGVANIFYYYSGANTRLLVDKWTQFQGALTVGASGVGKAVDLSPDSGNTMEWRNNGFYSAATAPDLSNYYTKSQSDARYLQLTGGAVTGALTVQGKAVAASPDSGNALEFRSNGFYAGGGGGGSFSSIRDEEFAPAAAATSVVLAATPVNIVMVSRNGVVQSQAAGNYSLAGSTITFTDAFVAGERVAVVYEIGVAAGDLAYTKNDSDLRFVNVTGDLMTGNLGVGTTAFAAWHASNYKVIQVGQAGALLADTTGVATRLSTNFYYNSSFSSRAIVAGAAARLSLQGNTLLYENAPSAAADAVLTFTPRFTIDPSGNAGFGAVPAAWVNTYKTVQLGLGGSVTGPTDAANLFLNANTYQDGGGWKAINAGGGVTLQLGASGTVSMFTAPSVAAGAAHTFTNRLSVSQVGTVTLTPDAGVDALLVNGQISAGPPTGRVGLYVNKPLNENALVVRVGTGGANMIIDATAGGLPRIRCDSYLQLHSDAGYVQPDVDNNQNLGSGGARWSTVYAVAPAINTSSIKYKDHLEDLDPERALAAVLRTPTRRFNYKGQEQVFSGYYMEEADELFTIGPDQTSPGNDVGILLGAIKALCARLGIEA